MSTGALEKLFGSAERVRIIKLFLFNAHSIFGKGDVIRRSKVSKDVARRELTLLESVGLIRPKTHYIEKKKSNGEMVKRKESGYGMNEGFRLTLPLQNLLIHTAPVEHDIVKKMSKAGKIKLIALSGIFLNDDDGRIDLLVVGDEVKNGSLKSSISIIESELGKELRYAVFDTVDFKYRMSVCDRLVRDLLDYPHKILMDKIGME
jgi:hypothetical protein